MDYQAKLEEHLQIIVGKRLDAINVACEMMMFSFEEYELHTQCLTRIICENDILVTTSDYQSWDGQEEANNDEYYFLERHKARMDGGIVLSVSISPLRDVIVVLDNGVKIELFVQNGYNHFDDEHEQWAFFKHNDHSYPFITVYNKTVDIAVDW